MDSSPSSCALESEIFFMYAGCFRAEGDPDFALSMVFVLEILWLPSP